MNTELSSSLPLAADSRLNGNSVPALLSGRVKSALESTRVVAHDVHDEVHFLSRLVFITVFVVFSQLYLTHLGITRDIQCLLRAHTNASLLVCIVRKACKHVCTVDVHEARFVFSQDSYARSCRLLYRRSSREQF